jgi:hypothetical protein
MKKVILRPKDLFSQSINEQLKKADAIIEKLITAVPNVTAAGVDRENNP